MPSAAPPSASREVYDSIDMIETMLENCPSGPILTTDWGVHPAQVRHRRHRGAPRGEDVHWAMLGNNQKCYRWRAKAATYSNWPVLRYMFRGNTVGDAALIVGSLDPCYSCTDRVTVTDVAAKARPCARQGAVRERLARQISACGRGHHGRSAR